MARLPVPGSDDGTWGNVLNTFLQTAHNSDGTLKNGVVTTTKLSAASPTTGQVLSYNGSDLAWTTVTGSGTVPDADGTTKGILRLAGDLGGTAASPTVPGLASKVNTTRTVNGHALSADVTVSKSDVGLANVDNTSDATKNSASATLTNKTLTAPVISTIVNTGTLTLPTTTDTLVGRTTTDTLTHKDLTAGTNTFPTFNQNTTGNASTATLATASNGLKSATTTVAVSAATAPTAGQVLTATGGSAANWQTPSGSGVVTWGSITGTLSSQTDLNSALTGKAANSVTITGATSLTGGGDLTANRTIALVGDAATPGNSKYYGTNSSGTKGYFALPAGGGGSSFTAVAKTTNYTASSYDFVVGDSSGALFTVTLPAPANGAWVRVKKIDASGNAILVVAPSGGTIDGGSSVSVNTRWQSQDFMSDGTTWYQT